MAGDNIDIPRGTAHRIENPGPSELIFIEVQHGDYFGEDDIVRLEDDFGRADGRRRATHLPMSRIADLLEKGPTYSFEFMPPKTDEELARLATTLRDLGPLEPSFVSVTYRGGPSSRQRTFDLVAGCSTPPR